MGRRKLLFSVTRKDLDIQTFRSGGPGGQHQNKRDSGVRIVHRESGARSEARGRSSQSQNKKAAFRRLVVSEEFQSWVKLEAGRMLMTDAEKLMLRKEIERTVQRQLVPRNLIVEYRMNSQWVREQEDIDG